LAAVKRLAKHSADIAAGPAVLALRKPTSGATHATGSGLMHLYGVAGGFQWPAVSLG
jgi:hypothetical protein